MPRTFTGTTEDSVYPILGASFWKPGKSIQGIFLERFIPPNSTIGALSVVQLRNSLKLKNENKSDGLPAWDNAPKHNWVEAADGDAYNKVMIGSLSGFEMAVRATGCGTLQPNDMIQVECTGTKPSAAGNNDQILFKVTVQRP